MNDVIIKADNLFKRYRLYKKPIDRLLESLNPWGKSYHQDFYALDDVSFAIKQGESIGIIGRNGSGKSTLLKILTGVLAPSGGKIKVNGRVSALLELGAGFNPEFTGLENIYLNGTIMDYSKSEIDARLDDILQFAGIGDFIYQPVKVYSSGMFVRLAFAVAINVDPEILIVDEALAVGDIRFQIKCMEKFQEFRERGKTIIFVSHDMSSIKKFCHKVLWLNSGKVKMFGEVNFVTDHYSDFLR
ncbi:MAG: ABC transporter ATP-binding protein, partial [bacterium]